MRNLGLIVLLSAFPALGADPSTGLPQDPWAFPAKDFITTCDTSHFKAKLAGVDADSPSFASDVSDVFARFAFCQGMVVGVSEMTQSNARLGLSKGGCRMESVSLQSVYATAAALYWKKPSEFDDVRASTLIFVALVEAYPCRATAAPQRRRRLGQLLFVFQKDQQGTAAMIAAGFHRALVDKPYEFEVSYFLAAPLVVRGIKDADTLLALLSSAGLYGPSPSPADRGTSPAEAAALIVALPHDNAGPIRLHFQDHAFHLAIEALTVGV